MNGNIELKTLVKNKYSKVVSAGGGCGCCDPTTETLTDGSLNMAEDYSALEGYLPEADYQLGCGVPTRHAEIKAGDTVLDLGSGAGNDAFVVQRIVGGSGRVLGLDFTTEMVTKARQNSSKLGLDNVEFIQGDIEEMPVASAAIDVVISNCVLNLVPDKEKAFGEIFRVLKPGAHFCVSDIVAIGELPAELRKSAELYAGCVAGALEKDAYLKLVKDAGFTGIEVRQARKIDIPEGVVREHLSAETLTAWESANLGLESITLFAVKPA